MANYPAYASLHHPSMQGDAKVMQQVNIGGTTDNKPSAQCDEIFGTIDNIDGVIVRITAQISQLCGAWPADPEPDFPASNGALNDLEARIQAQYRRLATLTDVLGRVVNA